MNKAQHIIKSLSLALLRILLPLKEWGAGVSRALVKVLLRLADVGYLHRKWTIRKYASPEHFAAGIEDIDNRVVIEHNLLLNEGITPALQLICGIAATAFSNGNANIGVGDSATAAAASQTGLQAASNKLYKSMEASYPQVSAQTATWRASFGASEGNFSWQEITVANGNSDAAANLNRLVQDMGTKASPAVWTVDLDITLS